MLEGGRERDGRKQVRERVGVCWREGEREGRKQVRERWGREEGRKQLRQRVGVGERKREGGGEEGRESLSLYIEFVFVCFRGTHGN